MKNKTLVALAIATSAPAFAATEYDLDISNTASLTYSVASNPQGNITVEDTEDFKVDRRVAFTLTAPNALSAAQNVGTQQAVEYSLVNSSNAPLRFVFTTTDGDTGATAYSGAAVDDTAVATLPLGVAVYQEDGRTPGFQSTEDSLVTTTFVELAANDDAADGPDETTIYVVATPSQGEDQDIFVHTLSAEAVEPTGTLITGANPGDAITSNDGDAWNQALVQTVVGADGLTRANNGAIQVASATLTMNKTVDIESDPVNGATPEAKAIPGAIVEYTITVSNSGSVDATNVIITDTVPAPFDLTDTYVEIFSVTDGSGTTTAPVAGSNPSDVTVAGNALTFPALTVPASGSVSVTFTAELP